MHPNFTWTRALIFLGSTTAVLLIWDWQGIPVLAVVVVLLIASLCFFQTTEDRIKEAKAHAEIALANQQKRLADKDIPISVAPQAAMLALETDLRIKLLQAEADIKLATEKGNANKVLEFTKKKFELEQELKKLGRV